MFNGKRVFITGGSKGLGRALSLEIAKKGAEVLTVARTESQLQSLQQEIKNNGGKLSYLSADITKKKSLEDIIDWIYKTGGVEIMIHNAGYLPGSIAPDSTLEEYQKALELNMITPLYLTEQWLKNYKEGKRKPELVFSISSISGLRSWDDVSPAYTASKAGVTAGLQNIRLYAEKNGLDLRFASIFPHTIDTDMVKGKSWTRMKKSVVIEAINGMLKKEIPYTLDNVVLEIKEDGIYAGSMPIHKISQRPLYDKTTWVKVSGNEKVIRS